MIVKVLSEGFALKADVTDERFSFGQTASNAPDGYFSPAAKNR